MCNEDEMKPGPKQDWVIKFLRKHGNQKFYKFEEWLLEPSHKFNNFHHKLGKVKTKEFVLQPNQW